MSSAQEPPADKLTQIIEDVTRLREQAREDKDVIRLNCVDDKLAQLAELAAIAERARAELAEATARDDDEARRHQLGRLTIVEQQAEVLASEAEACVGEELSFLGPTEVDVDAPELPEDLAGAPDFPVVEPLPIASPQE